MTIKKGFMLAVIYILALAGCSTTEEQDAENTEQTDQARALTRTEKSEPEEPELLFSTESEYHGDVDGFKSYENENSFTYQTRFDTLEELLGEATNISRPTLSAVLTKVDEPLVFYITDSFRDTTRASVELALIFYDEMVTTYSFHLNNYTESHPETDLILEDFIGKSVDEVAVMADENQERLFELTREEIISENKDNEDLVYQYNQLDYISPEPQPFELIFSENYPDGQLIRKYSKILLQNKESESDLMNEQLENFNDYQVTYNLLLEDNYRSIPGDGVYLLGFKTDESSFVTIYEGRSSDGFIFDTDHTTGINTENISLSW